MIINLTHYFHSFTHAHPVCNQALNVQYAGGVAMLISDEPFDDEERVRVGSGSGVVK